MLSQTLIYSASPKKLQFLPTTSNRRARFVPVLVRAGMLGAGMIGGVMSNSTQHAKVAIIMGSQSDWDTMKEAADVLTALGVDSDARIVSAHRTPDRLIEFAKGAAEAGVHVIIAGAGGAAHLPGMVASMTHLPVLGVPV